MNRRAFLAAITAVAAVPAVVSAKQRAIARVRRIGLQLYTVRRAMATDLAGTLARIARIGYAEVEFAGYFGHPPAAVRAALRRAGLAAPSAHIGMPELERQWEKTVETAVAIGHDHLIFAWVPDEYRTLDGYKRLAERFNRAGELAARSGIRLGYHNYTYDFVRAGDGFLYDVLLAETDPRYVSMQLDVFWAVHGGADPAAYLRRHARRYDSLHVKDIGAGREMVDLGRGVIDWPRLIREAWRVGIGHYFVEHDEPADAFGAARSGFHYLRALRF